MHEAGRQVQLDSCIAVRDLSSGGGCPGRGSGSSDSLPADAIGLDGRLGTCIKLGNSGGVLHRACWAQSEMAAIPVRCWARILCVGLERLASAATSAQAARVL